MTFPARTRALDGLVASERPRMVAIAERILGDRSAAEDVAQDVFAGLTRSGRLASIAPGWLHAAAAHRAYNALRAERRRRDREAACRRLAPAGMGAEAAADDPAILAERADERRRVRAALARIGPKHAAILALRYGGLRYAEIAASLDIGITSVGTRLARAEAALAKELHS